MPAEPELTEKDIQYYRKNGFVRVRNLLPKEEAARYAARAMEIYDERQHTGNFGGGANMAVLR